jgi:hypothetical protein
MKDRMLVNKEDREGKGRALFLQHSVYLLICMTHSTFPKTDV